MQNRLTLAAITLAAIGTLLLAVGCRTSSETVVGTERSPVCPTCKNETRAVEAADVTYKQHVCQKCRSFLQVEDPNRWAEVRQYKLIHVCDKCKTIVEKCPQCEKKDN